MMIPEKPVTTKKSIFTLIISLGLFLSSNEVAALANSDPFNTEALITPNPQTAWHGTSIAVTDNADNATHSVAPSLPKHALSLTEITDFALRYNPTTHLAWAQAKLAAAALGSAKSSYLPEFDAGATNQYSANVFTHPSSSQNNFGPNFGLNYLLLDFGSRFNTAKASRFNVIAADLTQNSAIQQVILQVQEAYYLALGQQALVEANKKSVTEANTSLDAAQALRKQGMATIGDVYQSQASLAQANLNLQQAQGNYESSLGQLATAMGLPANTELKLLPLSSNAPIHQTTTNVTALLKAAQQHRPDLQAAEAQMRANQALLSATKAAALPKIQLTANASPNIVGISSGTDMNAAVSLTVPIFTGFSQTYNVRQARAQVEIAAATRDQLVQQISLQVWQAYFALQTAEKSISNTDILFKSSEQSMQQASGQYKAGVGNILMVLTAQASLANARVQSIQARLNWYTALAQLAAAVGTLDAT